MVIALGPAAPAVPTRSGAAITPGSVLWGLGISILFLGVLHGLTYLCWYSERCGPARGFWMSFGYLFDMNREMNLPTWFSTVQLAAAATLLLVPATIAETGRWGWRMLVPLFAYLSLDEASDMHGLWIKAMGDTRIEGVNEGFNWIIPGAVVVALVALSFIPWLLRLPLRTRLLLLGSGAVYVAGGLGMEAIGMLTANESSSNPLYLLVSTGEEMLEMFGISLMIFTVLDSVRGRRFEIQVAE